MKAMTATHSLPILTSLRGIGPFELLLVPGLVPDGPETFLRQQRMLRLFGNTTTLTYPYQSFDLDAVLTTVSSFVNHANQRGRLPILVGVSVGGAMCLELLRRVRDQGKELPLAALVLISPLTCAEDLAPLLRRLLEPIFTADSKPDGKPEEALERGRTFFRTLANRSVPNGQRNTGWKRIVEFVTPSGLAAIADRRIRARIERTIEAIPTHGGIERVLMMRDLPGIGGGKGQRPLSKAPTLILWGSKERHTLNMDGPGTGVLSRPDLACRHFPTLEVRWIYDSEGGEVPHASLLKHAHAFNQPLSNFLKRCLKNQPSRRTSNRGKAIGAGAGGALAPD